MLYDYQASAGFPHLQREQDLLVDTSNKFPAGLVVGKQEVSEPKLPSGQFDDALNEEDLMAAAVEQSAKTLATTKTIATPLLSADAKCPEKTSSTATAVPVEEEAKKTPKDGASTDPLQFLSELAAQRSTIEFDDSPMNQKARSPKRVSLSPGHFKSLQHVPNAEKDAPIPPVLLQKQTVHEISPTCSSSKSSTSSAPAKASSYNELQNAFQTPQAESDFKMVVDTSTTTAAPRKSFEERYLELRAYKARFGHAEVLTTGDYMGLGRWITNLRSRFRTGSLSMDRAKLMHELGCSGFDPTAMAQLQVTNPVEYAGSRESEEMFDDDDKSSSEDEILLERAVSGTKSNIFPTEQTLAAHNHHLLPFAQSNRHMTGPPRDGWAARRYGSESRTLFVARGEPSSRQPAMPYQYRPPATMPPHQTQHHHHHPMTVPRRPQHMQWNYRVHQLSAFHKQFGHCHVTTTSMHTNKKEHLDLALWLAQQRHLHRKGLLSKERAHVLHNHFGVPGFEPRPQSQEPSSASTTNSTPLQTAPVESHYHHIRSLNERGISSWESTPAGYHPSVAASSQQAYPYPSSVPGTSASTRMAPSSTPIGVSAPTYANNAPYPPPTRQNDYTVYRPETPVVHHALPSSFQQAGEILAPLEQQAVVSSRGADGDHKPRKRGQYVGWHERLEQLIQFRQKRGHCDARIVLHDDNDSKELGRWLASQRHQYRKGKLPKDKVEILQNLGVQLSFKKNQSY